MGVSKVELFSDKINDTANLLRAMAHPARIAIIEYLLAHKSCICSSIVEELPLAQATISQHLKALKQAGIIQGQIEGKTICYCLNPIALNKVQLYFQQTMNSLSTLENKCY